MTDLEPMQVPKILKSLLWAHLLIDRADFWYGGPILLRLRRKMAIAVLGPPFLPLPPIQPFYRYGGGGHGLGKPSAAIAIFLCNPSKNGPSYQKSARSINKCGQSRLFFWYIHRLLICHKILPPQCLFGIPSMSVFLRSSRSLGSPLPW